MGSRDRAWPFSIFYEGDAEAFHDYARAILSGVPYDNGIPFHPPLFPYVLAGLHAILGSPVPNELLRAILAIAGAVIPAMLYRVARDAIGRGPALAAGLLAAFSFALDAIGSSATSEGLYLLLLFGMLSVAVVPPAAGRSGILRGAALGLLTGLLALTRAEGIVAGVLLLGVWMRGGAAARVPARRAARIALAWAAGLVLVLAPWTARNAVRLSAWNARSGAAIGTRLPVFVPLTAYGPLNFALANCDSATGGFQRKLLTSGRQSAVLNLADPQHRRYFLDGTGEGLRWIARHPGAFARLLGRKIEITSRALSLGWTPWDLPAGRAGTRLPVDLFAPDRGGLLRWAQALLAAAGLVLLLRRRAPATAVALIGVPIATSLLAASLFFGYVRLGALCLPSVFALEGVALAAAASRLPAAWRARITGRAVRWTLCGVALAVLALAAAQNRDYTVSGTSDRPGGTLNRDAPIVITPAR